MKQIYTFGKVDYNGNGRKTHEVTIEIELKQENGKETFTAGGNVWNSKHTDIVMGGQCIDDIWKEYGNQLENRKLYQMIMRLWKQYHLNDMHAGCIHQDGWENILLDDSKPKTQENMAIWTYPLDTPLEAIGRYILSKLHGKAFKVARKFIKINGWATNQHKKGLLTKACKICGHKYGSDWQYRAIPDYDMKVIRGLFIK